MSKQISAMAQTSNLV